ncbi:FGGY-family carbohydrate kinase [Geochorda subterranea]|uniref:FGGY-family carbohydrate kinase n=1 Tax=Geochorda subterranea TaxID=3109564 RepID=A0ABZ1BM30_9FIRM|nr:FGGY-family carbohydrate kinase [Limnochorda sp. LNt]WRP13739.1 FGGY-family carbohydrate kinase [Limnochorda sp. LNt]
MVTSVAGLHETLFGQMTFHPQAEPRALYCMGSHFTGGLAMAWLAQALAPSGVPGEAAVASAIPFEELEAEAASCPPGTEGVLWLPFLVGGGTPGFDPALAAAWLGLRSGHWRPHLVRSVMEGVAFNLRESVELLQQAAVPVETIRVGAGGLRSPLWRNIVAGVLGRPLQCVEVGDVSALGAALMAGVGAGWWPSLAEASRAAVRLGPIVEPPADWVAAHEPLFRSYRQAVRHEDAVHHANPT